MSPKGRIFLGIDPGFANLGYTVVEVSQTSIKALDSGVFRTKKSDKKRKILAVEDNLSRAKEISEFLDTLISKWGVRVICAEAMSAPRNASAAAKVSMAWGVLACLSVTRRIPIVQNSPQEIKKALCGDKSASKKQIQEVVERQLNLAPLLVKLAEGLLEHAYDSGSAVLLGVKSDLVQFILTDEA